MKQPIYKLTFSFDQPFFIGRYGGSYGSQWQQKRLEFLHFHSGLEIFGIIRGEARVHYNGKEFVVRPHDCVFLDAMLPHHNAGEDFELVVAHLSTDSVINAHATIGDYSLLQPFLLTRNSIEPVLKDRPDLIKTLVKAHALFASDDAFDKLESWTEVQRVLVAISRSVLPASEAKQPSSWSKRNPQIARIVHFINGNLEANICLDRIAKEFALSASRLSHLFKESMGSSLIEYRNRMRINKAIELITTTDDKLSFVSHRCGFKSLSQFHILFRKIAGTSPASLRAERSE